jgi:ATP-dependent phosphofructokinase / diphosphate-dependent phosphofructokinase
VALHGTQIVRIPLADATDTTKKVDPSLYEEFEVFFG